MESGVCLNQIIQTYILPNIGSILLFFVTLGLLCVTSRYMRATRAMADVMKREQDIKLVPLIEISPGKISRIQQSCEIVASFHITNKGTYFVQLIGYEVKCWHENHEEKPVFLVKEKLVKFIAPKDHPTKIGVAIPLKELYEKTGIPVPQKIKMLRIGDPAPQKNTVAVKTTFNFLNAGISPFSQSCTFFEPFP